MIFTSCLDTEELWNNINNSKFRRGSRESLDGGLDNNATGVLFGHSLMKLVQPDNTLPKPVMEMLTQLFLKGPFTVGIFRKSANARLVRELKEKLDSGDVEGTDDLQEVQIPVVAALLKDFLRSMPDCLLVSDFYDEWIELIHITDYRKRIAKTRLLCSRLPRPHLKLLVHFLCVLNRIVNHASENMMSASNLAVCIGPSVLWQSSSFLPTDPEDFREISAVVEFLIERCTDIFGKNILHLLAEPQKKRGYADVSRKYQDNTIYRIPAGESRTMVNSPPHVVNSNFQRHDWMRCNSNLPRISRLTTRL